MKSILLSLLIFGIIKHGNAQDGQPTSGESLAHSSGFDHSHAAWTEILKKHTVATGPMSQFNYVEMRKNMAALNTYLATLSAVEKSDFTKWERDQQMAFYINAYNAFTIKLISDRKPKNSIKEIREGLFTGPWKIKFFTLLGEKMHLDNIEHGILRPKYKDPRIHFAVNCASIGCPMLLDEAFTAEKLEAQFEQQAKLFLQDTTRNRIDKGKKTVYLSKIFDWFDDDFENHSKTVQAYVAKYMTDDPELQKAILKYDDKYLSYDWNLNQVK